MNNHVTLSNYKDDKYYPKVVRAVGEILESSRTVRATEVFHLAGVLSAENYKKWQTGQIKYLEKVIDCNLSKANRILKILGFHAHDLNMVKSSNFEKHKGKILRFTKNGNKKSEEIYAIQFNIIGKKC